MNNPPEHNDPRTERERQLQQKAEALRRQEAPPMVLDRNRIAMEVLRACADRSAPPAEVADYAYRVADAMIMRSKR